MKIRTILSITAATGFLIPWGLLAADTDNDGLDDAVESNTGEYVSPTDTGTDPGNADSDGDGAGDWYEVAGSFTDPNNGADKPNVPYPLPAPDATPPATNRPVKVYILSGQSNMVGHGNLDPIGTAGTLSTITRTEHKFPNLLDGAGWSARNDVTYRGVIAATGNAPLTAGQGTGSSSIGPELGFGHVMGYFHEEPVLLIKSSQGGRALGWDFLPPGMAQYTYGSTTYAGYGESPKSWPTGTTPVPDGNYAGYQYDQCFLDEADWAPISSSGPVTSVPDILDNFTAQYPQWADQGFEIVGFAWFQGWNDGLSYTQAYAYNYETHMPQFIREIRAYYENRYPDNIRPDAPFVVATCAFNGWDAAYTNRYPTRAAVLNAQLAVGDSVTYPDFAGNVKSVEARGYWRDTAESPSNAGYHYNRNAETYMLVGDALARGMIDLIRSTDYTSWAEPYNNAVGGDGIGEPGDDYDLDDVVNEAERIWGLDPTSAASHKALNQGLSTDGTFTYKRRSAALTGASFTVWTSTDMKAWDPDPGAVQSAGPTDADNNETVTVTLSPALRDQPKVFVQVRADG